jgi:Fe-S-cluster containining protein
MQYVTDIKTIKTLAAEREDENWRFRSHLKCSDLGGEKIDAIVHELNDRVSSAIDCQSCGNCCRVMHPILEAGDIDRLSAHLSIPPEEFRDTYLAKEEDEEGFIFKESPCPFLSGNSCSVYEARPGSCRSYPHLHKKGFVSRLIGVVSNCSVCPIVFHVFEQLKGRVYALERSSDYEDFE